MLLVEEDDSEQPLKGDAKRLRHRAGSRDLATYDLQCTSIYLTAW